MVSSADIANQAVQLIGGYDNNSALTGVPPTFDGTPLGLAAGILYNPVVAAVARQRGWDYLRNATALALTGAVAPFGYSYEYFYPATAVQLHEVMAAAVADATDPRPVNWTVGNAFSPSTYASGSLTFGVNPSDGDTITLNGYTITFKNAVTLPATQCFINTVPGSLAFTLSNLISGPFASAAFLNSALVNVASYSVTSTKVNVVYKLPGTVGNAYTLAASVATRSGATLTGGGNAQQKVIWTNQVGAYASISNTPPETVWDPLFTQAVINLLGSLLARAIPGKPESAVQLLETYGEFLGAAADRGDQ